jgi:UDP-N-acetylmuramate: L-alanyl-gamma-D-glutamyl-meso-diaminopimelate ligase
MSDQLRALGIELVEGYGADQMAFQPDVWVIGNVVSRARLPDGTPRYPLMEAILASGGRYTSGPQWLAEHVLQGRHVLAVAGTHGKTTTTSMLAWALEPPAASRLPGRRRAGRFRRLGPAGHGPAVRHRGRRIRHRVLRQAQQVRPLPAAHGGAEQPGVRPRRHLRRPRGHRAPVPPPRANRAGVRPRGRERPGGKPARVLHQGCWSEVRSFGAAVSDFTAQGEPGAFDVLLRGERVGRVEWELSGTHNQLNALAAIAAAEHVGVAPADAARALGDSATSSGAWNCAARQAACAVYDDFAHHPTAIRTTLDGLRRKLGPGGGRILAVFEPRSNTMKLGAMKAQLPWSLEQADLAFCHSGGLGWDAWSVRVSTSPTSRWCRPTATRRHRCGTTGPNWPECSSLFSRGGP